MQHKFNILLLLSLFGLWACGDDSDDNDKKPTEPVIEDNSVLYDGEAYNLTHGLIIDNGTYTADQNTTPSHYHYTIRLSQGVIEESSTEVNSDIVVFADLYSLGVESFTPGEYTITDFSSTENFASAGIYLDSDDNGKIDLAGNTDTKLMAKEGLIKIVQDNQSTNTYTVEVNLTLSNNKVIKGNYTGQYTKTEAPLGLNLAEYQGNKYDITHAYLFDQGPVSEGNSSDDTHFLRTIILSSGEFKINNQLIEGPIAFGIDFYSLGISEFELGTYSVGEYSSTSSYAEGSIIIDGNGDNKIDLTEDNDDDIILEAVSGTAKIIAVDEAKGEYTVQVDYVLENGQRAQANFTGVYNDFFNSPTPSDNEVVFLGEIYSIKDGIYADYGTTTNDTHFNRDFTLIDTSVENALDENYPEDIFGIYTELFSPASEFTAGTYTYYNGTETAGKYYFENAEVGIFNNSSQSEQTYEVTGGQVTVTINGNDNFDIIYDLVVEGGLTLKGNYSGKIQSEEDLGARVNQTSKFRRFTAKK